MEESTYKRLNNKKIIFAKVQGIKIGLVQLGRY